MTNHCRDPQRCSVCLGIPARRVDVVDGQVLLDGKHERSTDLGLPEEMRTRRHRGKK